MTIWCNKIFTSYSSLCVLLLVWVWFWCLVYFKSYGSLYDALLFQRLHIFRSLNPYKFWISSQKSIIPQIPILWLSLKTLKKLQALSVSSDKIMGDQKRSKAKSSKSLPFRTWPLTSQLTSNECKSYKNYFKNCAGSISLIKRVLIWLLRHCITYKQPFRGTVY